MNPMGVSMACTSPWALRSSQPSPGLDVFFLAQKFGAAAAAGLVGEKIIQAGQDRTLVFGDGDIAEEVELRFHIVAQCAGNEGRIGPRRPLDARGAHFRGRGRRNDAGTDDHPVGGILGHPYRRHGVAVPAAVGYYAGFHAFRGFGLVRIVGQGGRSDGAAGRWGAKWEPPCRRHRPGPFSRGHGNCGRGSEAFLRCLSSMERRLRR